MKQNREEWTEAVRRSLEGAEARLPEGGWERLERELEAIAPVASEGWLRRGAWIKFTAAAAAVLVCVSIGLRVVRSDRNVLERVVIVSDAAVSGSTAGAGEKAPEPAVHMAVRPEPVVSRVRRTEPSPAGASMAPSEREVEPATLSVDGDELVAPSVAATAGAGQRATSRRTPPEKQYATSDYDGLFADARPASRRGGGSIALSAGGIVTSANGTGGGGSSLLLAADGAASLRHAYKEYSYDHKQPLSFGVAFRKELGRGFSAETGLVYTFLRSSVSIPGCGHNVNQRLHLLGIPLRVNWEFLRAGGFSLYVGAGGMAEKCVSARFAGEAIREKQVQWSVSGLLGAQYRLGKTVGIYFEPKVSHYFTTTTLRTPYTDSSVNLDLQLGVRFNY